MNIKIISTGQEGQHTSLFPNTCFASGDVDITDEWLSANGCEKVVTTPVTPTTEEVHKQIINNIIFVIERHYDTVAHTKNYDNRLTCALRAGYAGPFQAEGIAFAIWMDTCNELGYQAISDVLAGLREIPSPEELISEFPTLVW